MSNIYANYETSKLVQIKDAIVDKFSATDSAGVAEEPNSVVEVMEQIVDVLDSMKASGTSIVATEEYANDVVEALDRIKQGIDNMEVSGGGSSDFSTAEVTIEMSVSPISEYYMPVVELEYEEDGTVVNTLYGREEPYTVLVPLYKGKCTIYAEDNIVVSGNATYDSDNGTVLITGNCTLIAKGLD